MKLKSAPVYNCTVEHFKKCFVLRLVASYYYCGVYLWYFAACTLGWLTSTEAAYCTNSPGMTGVTKQLLRKKVKLRN